MVLDVWQSTSCEIDCGMLQVLPAALQAMQMLHDRITREPTAPLVFMTNGGGVSESVRAAQLSDMLGVRVRAEQVILSHTPMQVCSSLWPQAAHPVRCAV